MFFMIASCTGDGPMDELTFARHVKTKRILAATIGCIGPLAAQDFTLETAATILDAYAGIPLAQGMWQANHDPVPEDVLRYRFCAMHWIDLAGLLRYRARQEDRADWYRQCCNLLQGMCKVNGWDLKELSNMFISQRVQLT
jgi:hypothetical protein